MAPSRVRENRKEHLCGLAAAIGNVHDVRLAEFGMVCTDIWQIRLAPYAQRAGAG